MGRGSGVAREQVLTADGPGRRPKGESTNFQPFKNTFSSRNLERNMPKNAYFFETCYKNLCSLPLSCRVITPPTVTTLSSGFLALKALYCYQKKNKSSDSQCSAFASSMLLCLFFKFFLLFQTLQLLLVGVQ